MVLYNIAIALYYIALKTSALFGHKKAKLFLSLRKNQSVKSFEKFHVWIHAASAGEGNQAIPLAEQIKNICDCSITISFFSPAGYQFHSSSKIFDQVINIPIDKRDKVNQFYNQLQPNTVIFIKNELWINMLKRLNQENIPSFLVNANPTHFLQKKWLRSFQLSALRSFDQIYLTQTNLFEKSLALPISTIYGDTKYESAFNIKPKEEVRIAQFCKDNFTVIVGSSWSEEEKLIQQYLDSNSNIKVIIAPHEIGKSRIEAIKKLFPNSYSCFSDDKIDLSKQVLILDEIGILRFIYHYADAVVIGGGFGNGIHNVLEAIAQSMPVIIGPKYQKFDEVIQLVELNLVQSIKDSSTFATALNRLYQDKNYKQGLEKRINEFVSDNNGIAKPIATDIIKLLSNKFSV